MPQFVSAVVLAAGKSSRMGTLKQLLKVGERTLLETTLNAVAGSKVRETILVLGYQSDLIARSVPVVSTTILVINEDFEQGMSSSIRAGLKAVSPDASASFIVLADQPFLTPAVIDRLMAEYEKAGAAILLPVYKGFRGNPVLIDRSLFPEMMQITGDIGCRSLFGLHSEKILKVPVEDIGVLIDIDTAEDLAKVQTMKNTPAAELMADLKLEDRFVETFERQLVIVGQDDVARALVRLGKLLNFGVTVIDPLLSTRDLAEADVILNELDLTKARVTGSTYIVVGSRGKFDEEALQQALATSAAYIALVGNRKRGAELLQRLRSAGVAEQDLGRIRCPAGLDIHASTPEEIALSVIAEIVAENRS